MARDFCKVCGEDRGHPSQHKRHDCTGKPRDAKTKTVVYFDPKHDPFERTAIVVPAGADVGSIDVVAPKADGTMERLCQINIVHCEGGKRLIVDVIDVEKRYKTRRAFLFSPSARERVDCPPGGVLVSTDFSNED